MIVGSCAICAQPIGLEHKIDYKQKAQRSAENIAFWDKLLLPVAWLRPTPNSCAICPKQDVVSNGVDVIQAEITADSLDLILAEKQGNKKQSLELLKALAEKYTQQLHRSRALLVSYKGLKLAEELNDKRAVADFYSAIAQCYFLSGEIENALPMHLNCLAIAKEIGYSFGISSALVDVGSDYVALGQRDKALPYYLAAKTYADTLSGTIYEVHIYNSVGAAYQFMKKYDSAYFYTEKAYRIAVQLKNSRGMASTKTSLAGISYLKGENDKAKQMALELLATCRAINFTAQIPGVLNILKDVYLKEGNDKEALIAYEQYIHIRDSITNDRATKLAKEKEFAYKLEQRENENLLLLQHNNIQQLKISQSRSVLVALSALVVAILLIGYSLYRQNKFKVLQQQVISEQKLLRAQMNPHFIFNSLNAIQHFIMSNQNRLAEKYLAKFSKLMRNILNVSTEENLSLSEELELLEGYLEIEALRFAGSFQFTIRVEDKLKIGNVRIPQLMIQPFIENAIWHGLLPKKDDRMVTVLFKHHSSDLLTCVIDDNGIGRQESSKMKTAETPKSMALELAKQRILLLRNSRKVDCKLTITDKLDTTGKSAGTTVMLQLPIIHR